MQNFVAISISNRIYYENSWCRNISSKLFRIVYYLLQICLKNYAKLSGANFYAFKIFAFLLECKNAKKSI